MLWYAYDGRYHLERGVGDAMMMLFPIYHLQVVSKSLTDKLAMGIEQAVEGNEAIKDPNAMLYATCLTFTLFLIYLLSHTGIGGVMILLYLAPKLTAVTLTVLPPVALGGWFYGKYVKRLSRKVQDALGKTAQFAEERLGNIRTVKSFVQEEPEEKRFAIK